MPLDSLESTLVHEMSDLLSAETQFARALQQVAKAADSEPVKQLAQEHYDETVQQIETLKQAFTVVGQKPERVTCKAAQGIVEENTSTLKEEKPKGAFKDIALLGGCLRVEHYEIAGYTAAIAVARALGQREVVQLLTQILRQEVATAKKLEAATPPILQSAKDGSSTGAQTASTSGGAKKAGGAAKSGGAAKAGGTKSGGSKTGGSKGGAKKAAK